MVMGLNFPVHIAVPCVYGFLVAKCRFYFVLSGDLNSLGAHNERLDAKTKQFTSEAIADFDARAAMNNLRFARLPWSSGAV